MSESGRPTNGLYTKRTDIPSIMSYLIATKYPRQPSVDVRQSKVLSQILIGQGGPSPSGHGWLHETKFAYERGIVV